MNQMLLLPVFVLVIMTFGLLIAVGTLRFRAVSRGEVRAKDIVLGQQAWPKQVMQVDRAYHNQLELPILFYVLVTLVILTNSQSTAFALVEWLFVALRLAHAFIHVTSNYLRARFFVFLAGAMVLSFAWLWFIAHIAFGL